MAIVECLVRLGSRGAAVVEFERLKELLRRELGVDPLPETASAIERALGLHALPPAPPRAPAGRPDRTPEIAEPVAAQGNGAIAQAGLKVRRGGSTP